MSKDDEVVDSTSEIKQEATSIEQMQSRVFKDDVAQEKVSVYVPKCN